MSATKRRDLFFGNGLVRSKGLRDAGGQWGLNFFGKLLAILSFDTIGVRSDPAWETWFYIPEDIFVEQLEALRQNHWNIIIIGAPDLMIGDEPPEAICTWDELGRLEEGGISVEFAWRDISCLLVTLAG